MKAVTWLYLFATAALPILVAGSCGNEEHAEFGRGALEGSSKTRFSLSMTVDPRIELLSVVLFLSDHGQRLGMNTRFDFPYKKDVIDRFSPYEKHHAVQLFDQGFEERQFEFGALVSGMLYLSNPPELRSAKPLPRHLKRGTGGSRRFKRFVEALRNFAQVTDFMRFFEEHKDVFSRTVADAQKEMEAIGFVGTLEDYYGMEQHSYNIILAPLFHYGGFGPRVKRQDGSYDVYCICGPSGVENGIPLFTPNDHVREIAWHEFSHSFINPITEKHGKRIARYWSLFEPIAKRMGQSGCGYGNLKKDPRLIEAYISENIVRAATARLSFIHSGDKERLQATLQGHKYRGFVFVDLIDQQLQRYENQRDRYPTFADFYPRLTEVFEVLSQKDLGADFYSPAFVGPIHLVFGDVNSIVFIVPTNENDKGAESKIRAAVHKRRDNYYEGRSVLTDREALERDLSGNSLVVYGTMSGNLWLAQHAAELPVRVESGEIVADSVYSGAHLRLITALPNPQNPKKGMVIYTAPQAEDVVGMDDLSIGLADYVVARGTDILKKGIYRKHENKWSF